MARRTLGSDPVVWSIKPYNDLRNAFDAIRALAIPNRPLGLVTGPAGCGKTYTAHLYANQNPGITIATIPPRDILTPRLILDEIARSIEVEPAAYKTTASIFGAVADAIEERRLFLIVDEADRLRPSNADMLRELSEVSRQPVCYLGCPTLEMTLARVPATHHRIGFRHSVAACDRDEILRTLVGMGLQGGRRIDEPTASAIWDVTHGNLRHIESIVRQLSGAVKRSTGKHWDVTPGSVKSLNAKFIKAA